MKVKKQVKVDVTIPQYHFGPDEIETPQTAIASLFRLFAKVMQLVYLSWNEFEPEYSQQEVDNATQLWKEKLDIAATRWGGTADFWSGLGDLSEQMRSWKPESMTNKAKMDAVIKEQMALVRHLQGVVGSKQPDAQVDQSTRLKWHGSTIQFIEIVDGLARKGYLEIPGGNVIEYIRRLQRSIVVLKEDESSELSSDSLVNRFRLKRDESLRAKMDALPDAKRRKSRK